MFIVFNDGTNSGGGGGGTVDTLNNGLTLTGTNGQLGGDLVQDTTVTPNGFDLNLGPVTITDAEATCSVAPVNPTDIVRLEDLPAGGLTGADNGLSVSGTTAQLGGNILKATTVTPNTHTLNIGPLAVTDSELSSSVAPVNPNDLVRLTDLPSLAGFFTLAAPNQVVTQAPTFNGIVTTNAALLANGVAVFASTTVFQGTTEFQGATEVPGGNSINFYNAGNTDSYVTGYTGVYPGYSVGNSMGAFYLSGNQLYDSTGVAYLKAGSISAALIVSKNKLPGIMASQNIVTYADVSGTETMYRVTATVNQSGGAGTCTLDLSFTDTNGNASGNQILASTNASGPSATTLIRPCYVQAGSNVVINLVITGTAVADVAYTIELMD